MDCMDFFPSCAMQFDHRPGSIKNFTIGQAPPYGDVKIVAEIKKCDVVCANCHAVRTESRRANNLLNRVHSS